MRDVLYWENPGRCGCCPLAAKASFIGGGSSFAIYVERDGEGEWQEGGLFVVVFFYQDRTIDSDSALLCCPRANITQVETNLLVTYTFTTLFASRAWFLNHLVNALHAPTTYLWMIKNFPSLVREEAAWFVGSLAEFKTYCRVRYPRVPLQRGVSHLL